MGIAFKKQKFILVTSVLILEEVEDVISRDHLVKKYNLTPSDRKETIETLVNLAVVVPGLVEVEAVKDDPDDNKFVSAALEWQADYIVSGDPHLLKLKQYNKVKIVSPKEFVEVLKRQATKQ